MFFRSLSETVRSASVNALNILWEAFDFSSRVFVYLARPLPAHRLPCISLEKDCRTVKETLPLRQSKITSPGRSNM